jgi:hypothetical protein
MQRERPSALLFALLFLGGCSAEAGALTAAIAAPRAAVTPAPTPSGVTVASPVAPEPSASAAPPSAAPVPDEALSPARPGPCPAPSEAIRALFARAARLEAEAGGQDPPRAVTEAIRLRLDELYQSGCRSSLDDKAVVAEVERLSEGLSSPPTLFGQSLGPRTLMFGHHAPGASTVAMYTFLRGQLRTRVLVTSEGPELERTLMLLDAGLFQPSGVSEPLLVVANTHPWYASCWRGLRFRVLAASGNPDKPTALLDKLADGRWCEEVSVETEGDEVRFLYDTWAGPLHFGDVQRPRALAYRWSAGTLEQRFGFAGGFHHLVESWLGESWLLAEQATLASEAARLAPIHDVLAERAAKADKGAGESDGQTFRFELFPAGDPGRRRVVIYCSTLEGGKPCVDWPKPVDFLLTLDQKTWLIADAKPRL